MFTVLSLLSFLLSFCGRNGGSIRSPLDSRQWRFFDFVLGQFWEARAAASIGWNNVSCHCHSWGHSGRRQYQRERQFSRYNTAATTQRRTLSSSTANASSSAELSSTPTSAASSNTVASGLRPCFSGQLGTKRLVEPANGTIILSGGYTPSSHEPLRRGGTTLGH